MFSWVLGSLWVLVAIDYVEAKTGIDYVWASRISVCVCLATGLIELIRMAEVSRRGVSEQRTWRQIPTYGRSLAEKTIILGYSFIIFGQIRNRTTRRWLAYFIIFGFLIYTETLFEILHSDKSVSAIGLIAAILFSYFPMRLILLMKPPSSIIEFVSAFTGFGIFIYCLFF